MRLSQAWATCGWLLLHAGASSGAIHGVGIGDCADQPRGPLLSCFAPAETTINIGDSVRFYQYADLQFTGAHNVVADDGSFRCARGCDGEGGDGTPTSDFTCNPANACGWNPDRIDFVRVFKAPGVVGFHDEVSNAAGTIKVLAPPTIHLDISEIYSNADGTSQFIMLWLNAGDSFAARELISLSTSGRHTFTFSGDVTNGSAGRVLLATRAFAELHSLKSDAVLPDGFLFAPGGTLSVMNALFRFPYTSLPTDGGHALYPVVDYDIGTVDYLTGPAVAVNHAGESVALAPIEITEVLEYYHAALDDYFLTAYPAEIAALDAGRIAGWQRTGFTLPTWSGAPVDARVVPGLWPVCRFFLGTSHFFSVNGCVDAAALPGATSESGNAFFAMTPDPETGQCPAGQVPVYQLWNPRGTTHRYVTNPAVRQQMLDIGYVAEGYGSTGVTMCVPINAFPGSRKR